MREYRKILSTTRYRKCAWRRTESGQVLAEYSIVLVTVVLISLALLGLLSAFMEYGWRIIELIAWEP